MAFIPGDFSAATLEPIKDMASSFWRNDNTNKHQQKPLTVFNCLAERQQVNLAGSRVNALSDGRKCQVVDLTFLIACNRPTVSCADAQGGEGADPTKMIDFCNPVGEEIGTSSMTLTTECLDYAQSRSVVFKQCKDMYDYQTKMAKAINQMKFELDNAAERRYIAYLLGNTDPIPWDATADINGTASSDGLTWVVTDTMLNAEFLACLKIESDDCYFTDPVLIAGKAYLKAKKLADARQGGNCCNEDSLLLSSEFNAFCHNTKDVDELAGGKTMLLVDAANVAYINTVEFPNMSPVQNIADKWTYHCESNRLRYNTGSGVTAVKYDVLIVRVCKGQSMGAFCDTIVMRHSGGWAKNPECCEEGCGSIFQISVDCPNCEVPTEEPVTP